MSRQFCRMSRSACDDTSDGAVCAGCSKRHLHMMRLHISVSCTATTRPSGLSPRTLQSISLPRSSITAYRTLRRSRAIATIRRAERHDSSAARQHCSNFTIMSPCGHAKKYGTDALCCSNVQVSRDAVSYTASSSSRATSTTTIRPRPTQRSTISATAVSASISQSSI